MTASILTAVPIKPFGVAKARLAPMLDTATRAALGKAVAARTVAAVAAVATPTVVVTGDPGVARWARRLGVGVVAEHAGGLDGAAQAVVAAARERGLPWAVVHADLPLLAAADLAAVLGPAAAGRPVLAPSRDGGTSAIAASGDFAFDYGAGSFHRHLRRWASRAPLVVARTGTAVDLDTVADLRRVLAHPRGAWVGGYL